MVNKRKTMSTLRCDCLLSSIQRQWSLSEITRLFGTATKNILVRWIGKFKLLSAWPCKLCKSAAAWVQKYRSIENRSELFDLTLTRRCVIRRTPSDTDLAFWMSKPAGTARADRNRTQASGGSDIEGWLLGSRGNSPRSTRKSCRAWRVPSVGCRACSGIKVPEWKWLCRDIPAVSRKGKIERKKEKPAGSSSSLTRLPA